MLYNFDVGIYRLELLAEDEIELPPYSGSTFRERFSYAFKSVYFDKDKVCHVCLLKEKCAYVYVFETSSPKDSTYLRKLSEIPKPFVIESPSENVYKKGEKIELGLILISKAIDYLPYFVVSLAYFYCEEKLNIDYKQMIEDAKKVEIKERHYYNGLDFSDQQLRYIVWYNSTKRRSEKCGKISSIGFMAKVALAAIKEEMTKARVVIEI